MSVSASDLRKLAEVGVAWAKAELRKDWAKWNEEHAAQENSGHSSNFAAQQSASDAAAYTAAGKHKEAAAAHRDAARNHSDAHKAYRAASSSARAGGDRGRAERLRDAADAHHGAASAHRDAAAEADDDARGRNHTKSKYREAAESASAQADDRSGYVSGKI